MMYARYYCGDYDGTVITQEEYRYLKATGQLNSDMIDYAPIFDGRIYKTLSESTFAQIEKYGWQYDDDRRTVSAEIDGLTPYRVVVSETFTRTVVIYAEDKDSAIEMAEDLCNESVIDLDAADFISRSTECVGEAKPRDVALYMAYGPDGVVPAHQRPSLDNVISSARSRTEPSGSAPEKESVR